MMAKAWSARAASIPRMVRDGNAPSQGGWRRLWVEQPLHQPQIPAQELLPSTEPVSMIGANPPVHLPAPVTSSDCGLRCGSRIVIGRMTMHATSERGHKERHGRLTVGHDAITAIMTSRSSLRSPPS
jgi:hypothetical protein